MSESENWMNERAAERLARRIERYWRQRGRKVRVWLEPCPGLADTGGAFVVRSDMVDGRPRNREATHGAARS
ncbi:MAG: hypothetical protein KIS96_10695 [Bauldia sp.]|nr:hypothetical protein [Bauldia sp.]